MTSLLSDAELAELRELNEANLMHVCAVRNPVTTSAPGAVVTSTYPADPDATYPCRASAVGQQTRLEQLIAGAPSVPQVYEVAFPAGTMIGATARLTVTGTTPRSDGSALAFTLPLAVQGGDAVVADAAMTLVTAVPVGALVETVVPPGGPTVTITVGNLVGDGNSLMAGVGIDNSGTSYLDGNVVQLVSTDYGCPGLNDGVSGQTTDQMLSDAASQIDPAYNASLGHNVLLVWELRNQYVADAKYNAIVGTARTVLDKLWTYVDGRRAAHPWDAIVLLPVLPTHDTATGLYTDTAFETWRQQINSLMTSEAMAHGCRVATFPDTIMAAGANTNTTYYRDQIHLTAAGYALCRQPIEDAITAALTPPTGGSLAASPTVLTLDLVAAGALVASPTALTLDTV